jgi:hypothetical protein
MLLSTISILILYKINGWRQQDLFVVRPLWVEPSTHTKIGLFIPFSLIWTEANDFASY